MQPTYLAKAVVLTNHCFRIFFSTLTPVLQDLPSSSTCSSDSAVSSKGSQLTRACSGINEN